MKTVASRFSGPAVGLNNVIKMSMRTRALVFSTFFGSCLAIGLLLVSLTTNHWVRANPRRKSSSEAAGEVNFGLFYGSQQLNPGFGVRTNPVDGKIFGCLIRNANFI